MKIQAALRILVLTFATLSFFYNGVNGKASEDIDMILKTLNKPALETITTEDGDVIDCVDIYKQPAFDHPALRDHKIQMKPSAELFSWMTNTTVNNGFSKPVILQSWPESGGCPVGTIPIRRVSREDISRASSPSQFGRKAPEVYNSLDKAYQHKSNINSTAEKILLGRPKYRSDVSFLTVGENYIGATSKINVWNPPRVQAGDYTSAQIKLLAGLSGLIDSIEAGWVVNPKVFGDNRTRLYTYWTGDSYQKTGCFNILCSGFVQTSSRIYLGSIIKPVSTTSNGQYDMTVIIMQDQHSRNWWLVCQQFVLGYWPSEIFTSLDHTATAVQWGGEVYSPNVRKRPHTKTPMGSGNWASSLWGYACYHTNMRIRDFSLSIKFPPYISKFSDEYKCYNSYYQGPTAKEAVFYFGGPGQNPQCP